MKINWKIVKKPSFIVGAIVLFFVILWLMNRHASTSSSTTSGIVTAPTVDPNQLAADTQIQLAEISAGVANAQTAGQVAQINAAGNVQVALAQIAAATQNQQTQVSAALGSQQIAAQAATDQANIALQAHAIDATTAQNASNNQFQLDYAKETYDYGLQTQEVNASLQQTLAANQLQAYEFSGLVSTVQQFGNPARREALFPQLAQFASTAPATVSFNSNPVTSVG